MTEEDDSLAFREGKIRLRFIRAKKKPAGSMSNYKDGQVYWMFPRHAAFPWWQLVDKIDYPFIPEASLEDSSLVYGDLNDMEKPAYLGLSGITVGPSGIKGGFIEPVAPPSSAEEVGGQDFPENPPTEEWEKEGVIRLHHVQGRRRFHVDDPRSTITSRLKPSGIKVFVAVPWLYGTIYPSCLKHIEALECPVEIMPAYYVKPKQEWRASRDPKDIEDKYAPSAANVNRYIQAFMRTDATHMLMVDADMEVPFHALDELLKLDVDIASGVSVGHATAQTSTVVKWFPKPRPKSHRSKPYWRFLRSAEVFGKMFYSPPDRLRTGAFCLLTKRRVFEKHHPKLSPLKFRWNPPQQYGIDLTFWEDARQWGFTSAIHGGVVCGHLPEFPLSKMAEIEWT